MPSGACSMKYWSTLSRNSIASSMNWLVAAPLVVVLEVDGGEAADGRAVLRGRQEDLGAEVGAVNGEPLVLEPGGQRAGWPGVGEDEIGLARVHAHLEKALPEVAGGDGRDDLAVVG